MRSPLRVCIAAPLLLLLTACNTTSERGAPGRVSEDEIVEYCKNVEACYDDQAPCTSLRADVNSEECKQQGHTLVGCVLDRGEIDQCEGDAIPCASAFSAFYACLDRDR